MSYTPDEEHATVLPAVPPRHGDVTNGRRRRRDHRYHLRDKVTSPSPPPHLSLTPTLLSRRHGKVTRSGACPTATGHTTTTAWWAGWRLEVGLSHQRANGADPHKLQRGAFVRSAHARAQRQFVGAGFRRRAVFDSEAIYTRIMDTICGEHNKRFSWQIKVKQMGQKEPVAGQILIDELDLPITVEQYCKKVHELSRKFMPEAEFMPGAEKLVHHLQKHKVPIAIATGSDRIGYDAKTSHHPEFFALFDPIVLSGEDPDVKHGKPAPDCFLVTARKFPDNPEPAKCLVFEDAPNGVAAGIAAGMPVVWVPDNRADHGPLKDKVSLLLNTLEEFKPEVFGLPPYDS